jgi:hypothetical protein
MAKVWVSRDSSEDAGRPDSVMITTAKPSVEHDTIEDCPHCGKAIGKVVYRVPSTGTTHGADGELCYNGWLKLTGFKLEKGELKQVTITVK